VVINREITTIMWLFRLSVYGGVDLKILRTEMVAKMVICNDVVTGDVGGAIARLQES